VAGIALDTIGVTGREAGGIVSPGAEYRTLADELSARLLTLADPEDGTRGPS